MCLSVHVLDENTKKSHTSLALGVCVCHACVLCACASRLCTVLYVHTLAWTVLNLRPSVITPSSYNSDKKTIFENWPSCLPHFFFAFCMQINQKLMCTIFHVADDGDDDENDDDLSPAHRTQFSQTVPYAQWCWQCLTNCNGIATDA